MSSPPLVPLALLTLLCAAPAVAAPGGSVPPQAAAPGPVQGGWYSLFGEPCNGRDDDGDGDVDEGYPDTDGDGVADCVDVETCDGVDNDGDGEIDEGHDRDGDGVGDCFETCRDTVVVCSGPDTVTLRDGSPAVATWVDPTWTTIPGATWVWDEVFEPSPGNARVVRMDAVIDLPDTAFDGLGLIEIAADDQFVLELRGRRAIVATDVTDNASQSRTFDISSFMRPGRNELTFYVRNAAGGPGASPTGNPAGLAFCFTGHVEYLGPEESCNGLDDDCDGVVDELWGDSDFDGVADCRDMEICDGLDNDGNGEIDEGYGDADGDGLANCVDVEECDGLDNDGDGEPDDGVTGFVAALGDTFARGSVGHGLWLPGIATDLVFDPPATFTEDEASGTATLTGRAVSASDPTIVFDVDVVLADRQTSPPPGSPKTELATHAYVSEGGPVDPSGWVYYGDMAGTLLGRGSMQGAYLAITLTGASWQQGYGASGKDAAYGASAWFLWGVIDPPASGVAIPIIGQGDFNLTGVGTCGDDPCNGLDDDGDGLIDEGASDQDADGLADCVDAELCNGRDDNGVGGVDEGYPDTDGDGVADCVDAETCDGIDNDGDGVADEDFTDGDGDGVADCVDVETCDGVDNDGDGVVDEFFGDSDRDGVADCVDVEECDGWDNDGDGVADDGFPDTDGDGLADCVDGETCDGLDNDGDGRIDEEYPDTDGDGVADCVDVEACDGLDNDGDGAVDEGFGDVDGDGVADCVDVETCDGVDNDGDGLADEGFPDSDGNGTADCVDVEICDGIDNTGDGVIDEGFADGDGDGVKDCVDVEECDGVDNDGDGQIDEGLNSLIFQLGVQDGAVDPILGAAEFPATDAWSPVFTYTVTGTGTSTPDMPGYLSDAPISTYVSDGRPLTDGTARLDIRFVLHEDHEGVVVNVGRYGSELNEVFVDVDGIPVTRLEGPGEGRYANELIWIGYLPAGERVLSLTYLGGGVGNGNYLDVIKVSDTTCLSGDKCDGLDNDGDGLVDEAWDDADGDGIADCVDVETCDGVDNDGDRLVDEGFASKLFELGSQEDDEPFEVATDEWPATGAWTEAFAYFVEDGGEPSPDLPAALTDAPGLTDLDATARLDVYFEASRSYYGALVRVGRFGGASSAVLIDLDGLPLTTLDGEGFQEDDLWLGTLTPGWHVLSLVFDGGATDEVVVLDSLHVYDAGCLDNDGCDGIDNDGDGRVDESYEDADGDGVADCVDVEECDGIDNDGDTLIDEDAPDADLDGVPDCVDVERCNGIDDNGFGGVDEGFPDTDGDGVADCVEVEECDGLDNDGDGRVDELFPDTDGDGVADCQDLEECDGLDNDGDGLVDEGYAGDADADGVLDCLDVEVCDHLDNDGDGAIDEGFVRGSRYVWEVPSYGARFGHQRAVYDTTDETFTFTTTINTLSGGVWNGMTFAASPGPNPKGHSDLALLYFDASNPSDIKITAYVYNGENLFSSYYDSLPAAGTQAPDRIVSSILDPSWVLAASWVNNGSSQTMSFTIDARAINSHQPRHIAPYQWTGLAFGDQFGVWYHPTWNVRTTYSGGWLSSYSYGSQAWIDLAYSPATSSPLCVAAR